MLLMKFRKTPLVRACLFLLAALPAYGQRGTLGIDVGQVSDKFDSLPRTTAVEVAIDGQVTVLKPSAKNGGPSIVAGGELRFPDDTTNHAKEYAVYGGPAFQIHNLSIGVNAQVRKLVMPPATVDNQVFSRNNMELFELPIVLKYNFGPARRAFIEAQGAPEFTPRWRASKLSLVSLPHPNLDHGYFIRGSVGYVFGKWYAKATYQTRYFKFTENAGNPSNLYNWKSNFITGGIGFAF
jgi:hypothetical protein